MRTQLLICFIAIIFFFPGSLFAVDYSLLFARVTSEGNAAYTKVNTTNELDEFVQLQVDRFGRVYGLCATGKHGGATERDLMWLRFKAFGALDADFNGSGKKILPDVVPDAPFFSPRTFTILTVHATTPLGTQLTADYMFVISRAKIDDDFRAVASLHYLGTGELVGDFGTNGYVILPHDIFDNFIPEKVFVTPNAGTVTPGDFYFIVAGRHYNSTKPMGAIRLTSTGEVDTSYGTDGMGLVPYQYSQSTTTHPNFMRVDYDMDKSGRVVFLAAVRDNSYNASPPKYDALVARLNTNGSFDTDFGTDGLARHELLDIESPSEVGCLKIVDRRAFPFPNIALEVLGPQELHHAHLANVASVTPTQPGVVSRHLTEIPMTPANPVNVSPGSVTPQVAKYFIYVGGGQKDGPDFQDVRKGLVLRLKEDGQLDTQFAQSGRLKFASRYLMDHSPNVMAIGEDENQNLYLALVGSLDVDPRPDHQPTNKRATVVKIDENGSLDAGFGNSGEANTTYVVMGDYHKGDDLFLNAFVVLHLGYSYLGFTYIPGF